MRSSGLGFAVGLGVALGVAVTPKHAAAAAFQDPPTFTSANGVLSVLVTAAIHTQPGLISPAGQDFSAVPFWTYQVCAYPNPVLVPKPAIPSCPSGTASYTNLGGVRFALKQGDTFRVRLVNELPRVTVDQAAHVADYGPLALNPTNIHTHGFIVDPHNANNSPTDPYGDYVLLELPPVNVEYTVSRPHETIINDGNNYVDYMYVLEANHPSGLFWMHPHLHGISLNQVSAGLGNIMTVGSAADDCGDAACVTAVSHATVRHLTLKDTQVVTPKGAPTSFTLQTQQDATMCGISMSAAASLGSCPGVSQPGAPYYPGSAWIHTVSGQIYPHIDVGPQGDVWEIVNGSGSRSYQLSVGDPAAPNPGNIPLQILSIDGATINVKARTSSATLATLLAGKIEQVPCPGSIVAPYQPICATKIRMMPSSRVAVRVINTGTTALKLALYTSFFMTGQGTNYDTGDPWPAMSLASVTLAQRGPTTPAAVATADLTSALVGATGQLQSQSAIRQAGANVLANASAAVSAALSPAASTCPALPPGSRRRIKFAFITDTQFGVGTEVVDANGNVTNVTPIEPFIPTQIKVCVPVAKDGQTYELWEVQNLTPEDHNFHIHQTRFFVVAGGLSPGYTIPKLLDGNLVLHDNVPVPQSSQTDCDGTTTGKLCAPTSTYLIIPFRELGDFVFHCHILEHEDNGMMARIHVQPAD